MRAGNTILKCESSLLSCENDTELILRKLLIESKPYSDILKSLLIINTKDCIDNIKSEKYQKILQEKSLADLIDEGYIKLNPKIKMQESEEVKSYIVISFDHFMQTSNPKYRDCTITFDIICHTDYWDVGNYRQRPIKIAGYIDGILNGNRLTGIGTLNFIGCDELVLSEDLSGYTLMYSATHGNDDKIERDD